MTSRDKQKNNIQNLTYAAILAAFGVLIPMVMPAKIIIGPASYTLASHVPVFLAMFISPSVAIFVALGSSLGFFLAGFPIVIVARALSHLVFASVGSFFLKNRPQFLSSLHHKLVFSLGINIIHALAEVAIVYILTSTNSTTESYWYTLLVLVGLGTLIHGTVDFFIASYVWDFTKKLKR